MNARRAWERVACTSVGLFRMGRDAVTSFFERAYAVGKRDGESSEAPSAEQSTLYGTDGEENG